MASLRIVIVNWNSGRLLDECISSIWPAWQSPVTELEIVIVDNASTDSSLHGLSVPGNANLRLIRNAENLGFAKACNQGADDCLTDYLLFLNPDTRLFTTSLKVPVAFLQQPSHEMVGICGIQLTDEKGVPNRSSSRFPTAFSILGGALGLNIALPRLFKGSRMIEWDHSQTAQVDQVIGAFFLVRKKLFRSLGGFDERFFVYFEDVDFSLRAAKAGWKSIYVADARAYHKGGGASQKVKAKRLFFSLRSRIQYAEKHFSGFAFVGVLLTTVGLEFVSRLMRGLIRFSAESVTNTTLAYFMLWANLPSLLRR